MTSYITFLAEQPILLLFLLIGVGMAFGAIKVRGMNLGAAAVLFLGIAFSASAAYLGIEATLPPLMGTLGLVLFAFGIGNNSGVSFFKSLRTATGPVLSMVGVFIAAAILAWVLGTFAFGMDIATIAGTFAGAITNTPALAAASEATGRSGDATVGYAVAYLFGVIGMLVTAIIVLRDAPNDKDATAPVMQMHMQVTRPGGVPVQELLDMGKSQVQFTRMRRVSSNDVTIPGILTVFNPGDVVTMVGTPHDLDAIIQAVGRESPQMLNDARHLIDFRRITISRHRLAGRTIAELNNELADRWGARISRLRRADEDRVAIPELAVELGDRVRVVAPAESMTKVSEFLGDSAKGLTDINPVALGLGLSLGVILGHINIPLPGNFSFHLGAAAGVLIVALIMGRIGRIGPMLTALPHSANTVLAELGLLMFLAQAGTNAGDQISGAFTGGAWWKILVLGMIITIFVAVGVALVMRRFMGMGATKTAGILGGAQTQPAVLAFVNNRTDDDPRVALGYALVYPVAMIAKILITHGLAMLG